MSFKWIFYEHLNENAPKNFPNSMHSHRKALIQVYEAKLAILFFYFHFRMRNYFRGENFAEIFEQT